jgi:regulator of sigma E protease
MTYLFSILGFLYSNILPFVILLGILIFVHELGHFLVARMCGVRVETFSLGFGKKILSYKKGDTTYCLSIVPLGGYVKMFGEQGSEAVITEDDKKVSFSHKNPWQRIAIVLAGPLMNFFFAIFVFALIAQVGEQTRSAVIADVTAGSPAAEMGLKAGDKVLQVASQPVRSYEEFQKSLNQFKGDTVSAVVEDTSGNKRQLSLNVTSIDNPNIFSLDSKLGQIEGVELYAKSTGVAVIAGSPAYKAGLRTGDEITAINDKKLTRLTELQAALLKSDSDLVIKATRTVAATATEKAVTSDLTFNLSKAETAKAHSLKDLGFDNNELYLDLIAKDSPAAAADLNRFDRIVSINNKPIEKWDDISETIKSFDGKEALTFVVDRDGAQIIKKITPKVTEQTNAFGVVEKRFTIGIGSYTSYAEPESIVLHSNSVFESVGKGYSRTVDISVMTVMSFVKLFQGQTSVKSLGGMVSIGKAAKDSFELGFQAFMMTMGILSVSLFILNLMPIPVLDGGHLVFYVIEVIKGSPLSLKKMEIAQQVGFILLIGLMILAQFNDIVKFLFKS